MRLLICGDREWTDRQGIYLLLEKAKPEIEVVIEGEARGADRLSRQCCEMLGIDHIKFPYLGQFGKAGGPIRNQQMLDQGRPTHLWAFHDFLESSRGTADMIVKAKSHKIPCRLYKHSPVCLAYSEL